MCVSSSLSQECRPGVTLNYLHSIAQHLLAMELQGELCASIMLWGLVLLMVEYFSPLPLSYSAGNHSYEFEWNYTVISKSSAAVPSLHPSLPPSLLQVINTLFPHDIGHYLGMDVHDCSLVDHNTPLSPGMVITIEPGVYIHNGFSISNPVKAKE